MANEGEVTAQLDLPYLSSRAAESRPSAHPCNQLLPFHLRAGKIVSLLEALLEQQKQQAEEDTSRGQVLQALLLHQTKEAAEGECATQTTAQFQRRRDWRDRRQSLVTSVANAMSVISALLAAALLASLLNPPDAAYKVDSWNQKDGVNATCVDFSISNLDGCKLWQAVYGVSTSFAFLFELMGLLVTIVVALGQATFLPIALSLVLNGVCCACLSILAAFWLSYPLFLALFAAFWLSSVIVLCYPILAMSFLNPMFFMVALRLPIQDGVFLGGEVILADIQKASKVHWLVCNWFALNCNVHRCYCHEKG
jgi:hypothetical protein